MGNNWNTYNNKERKNVKIKKYLDVIEILVKEKRDNDDYAIESSQEETLYDDLADKRKNNSIKSSVIRSRTMVKNYLYANDWSDAYFGDITFSSNRYDYVYAKKELNNLIRRLKYRDKDMRYIFFVDVHEDGAFHFHFLIKSSNDNLPIQMTGKVEAHGEVYEFTHKAYSAGYSYMTKVDAQDKEKAFTYLLEKINEKARSALPNENLYIVSKNLDAPVEEDIDVDDIYSFIEEQISSEGVVYKAKYDNAINTTYYIKKLI